MTAARSSTMMIAGSSSSGQTAVGRNQSGAATSAGNPAKYMLVSSRPSTPVQVSIIKLD